MVKIIYCSVEQLNNCIEYFSKIGYKYIGHDITKATKENYNFYNKNKWTLPGGRARTISVDNDVALVTFEVDENLNVSKKELIMEEIIEIDNKINKLNKTSSKSFIWMIIVGVIYPLISFVSLYACLQISIKIFLIIYFIISSPGIVLLILGIVFTIKKSKEAKLIKAHKEQMIEDLKKRKSELESSL